jgi:signal transduction histidine kinase
MAHPGQVIMHKHSGNENAFFDKKLLKNILFNLISNAIKFSPEGGAIEIDSHASNSSIKISVKDSGIGISAEDQKHLFERFFRAHNATHIQGTGLGLNIVARYVELMKGTIDFESKEHEGTQFTIIIPQ